MAIALLATAASIFGFLFLAACGVIIEQGREVSELEYENHKLRQALDGANTELEEMRCEYERSLGGTDYQWRPVNRISRMYPR